MKKERGFSRWHSPGCSIHTSLYTPCFWATGNPSNSLCVWKHRRCGETIHFSSHPFARQHWQLGQVLRYQNDAVNWKGTHKTMRGTEKMPGGKRMAEFNLLIRKKNWEVTQRQSISARVPSTSQKKNSSPLWKQAKHETMEAKEKKYKLKIQ